VVEDTSYQSLQQWWEAKIYVKFERKYGSGDEQGTFLTNKGYYAGYFG
jgi:hypothetical protein